MCSHGAGLLDKDGKYLEIDWYSVQDWKKYKIGLFSEESISPEDMHIYTQHLSHCLADGLRFRKLLYPKREDIDYPPITVLASDNIDTRWVIMKDGPQSVRGLDFDSPDKAPGDGRVPVDFTRPKGGVLLLH